MPDRVIITTPEIDQDSPVTQPLMTKYRDNINAAMWHPYDESTGVIYDHADPVTGGNTSAITSPTLEDGHNYLFIFYDLGTSSSGNRILQARLNYDDSSNSGFIDVMIDDSSYPNVMSFQLLFPRKGNGYGVLASVTQDHRPATLGAAVARATSATAKVNTVTIREEAGGDINDGYLVMLKCAEIYSDY